MASIKGLELKNVRKFVGHEGECYQGVLYLNGKKIGFWSQDQWGGADTFFFEPGLGINQMRFNQVVEETFPPVRYFESEFSYDLDYLMEDILQLRDREKAYKKHKDQFPVMVVLVDDRMMEYRQMFKDDTDENILLTMRGNISSYDFNDIVEVNIYRSLDDFNIGEPFKLEDITA